MRFRWVALLTLWTFLSGPMLALPVGGGPRELTISHQPKSQLKLPAPNRDTLQR